MKKRNKNEISESVLASSISRWLESSNGAMLGQPPTADQSSDVPFGRRPSCGGAGARPGQPGRPHAPHHPRAARPQPRAARGGVAADPPQAAAPEQPPPGHVPRPRQTPVTGTSSAVGHSAPAAVYCKCITASSIVAHHRVPPGWTPLPDGTFFFFSHLFCSFQSLPEVGSEFSPCSALFLLTVALRTKQQSPSHGEQTSAWGSVVILLSCGYPDN